MNKSENCSEHPNNRLPNKEVISIFTKRLNDNLGSYYKDLDKKEVEISGIPLGGQFAQTFKFIIRSDDIKHYVFIKICPIYNDLDVARKEFDTLITLFEKMNNSGNNITVSRPLDYYPDLNAYAMESVGTHDFRKYLLKYNSILRSDDSNCELLDLISGSAKWLSVFHGHTMSSHNIEFDYDNYIGGFEDEFDYRELVKFGFKNVIIDEIESVIGKLPDLTGMLKMPCAKWHWDYTPGHVYLDNGKISVIDILGVDDTPIYEDIGHFLAALTSINNLPFYPLFDHKRACFSLCDQFIRSYFSETDYDEKEFMLLTNIYRLKYLIVYFLGQYRLVCDKTHPAIGKLFVKYRMVGLFARPLEHTLGNITELMNNYSYSKSTNKTKSQ